MRTITVTQSRHASTLRPGAKVQASTFLAKPTKHGCTSLCLLAASLASIPNARADVVTDWNQRATAICAAAKLPPPPAYRSMAMVQTAVYQAVDSITSGDGLGQPSTEGAAASVDAAVAAANHIVLSTLIPSQQAAIDAEYQRALSAIPDGPAKSAGIAAGEQASAAVLTRRLDDGAMAPEAYRPRTTPRIYVPTVIPAAPQWPQREPWVMARADQFRPGPPPRLGSERWARDYNEVKELGAKNSTRRTPRQTDIARFWEASGPAIYFGLMRSVAMAPERDPAQNARFFAIGGQAMDDALIAVFDAKHHYQFWRPITAIRNGDQDGNTKTDRDGAWLPFVDTPMHPEYPCAHCILASSVGAVLKAEFDAGAMSSLSTSSVTAPGVVRSWTTVDDFVQEVADARVYDGVHYRNSTQVGMAMGTKVGELVAKKFPARQTNMSRLGGLGTSQ